MVLLVIAVPLAAVPEPGINGMIAPIFYKAIEMI
jgi:hypothetical protein